MYQGEIEPHHRCDERKPSEVMDDFWICAYRQMPGYPYAGRGKWLVHALRANIDNLWRICKLATEEGYLGSLSKVSTSALPSMIKTDLHVICIYTYDHQDYEDIMRVRAALRDLGIEQKIPYAILRGQQQIHLYYE